MSSTDNYRRTSRIPASPEEVFEWHARDGALQRLMPPWENVVVRRRTGGLEPGAQVELINRMGPLPLRWLAEHTHYEPHRYFLMKDWQSAGHRRDFGAFEQ